MSFVLVVWFVGGRKSTHDHFCGLRATLMHEVPLVIVHDSRVLEVGADHTVSHWQDARCALSISAYLGRPVRLQSLFI